MKPLISVVIPIYKAEDYLKDCLIGILNQQEQSWECILIEDGSPDNSGIICDEFALKDNRFKVIHKQNEGVSVARNTGTEIARGEWITYIDSDDIITSDFFNVFVDRLSKEKFDLFMGDVEQEKIDGTIFVEYRLPTILSTLDEAILVHRILRSGDLHGKFFKMEIINKNRIRFDEHIKYSEDGLFFDKYLSRCRYISLDGTICYKYKRNETGLSYRINSFESEYHCMKELINALTLISKSTGISLSLMLHDSPALRTLKSSIKDLTAKEFVAFTNELTDVESFFIEKALKNINHYGIFNMMFKNKKYYILYVLLKLKEVLHNIKTFSKL